MSFRLGLTDGVSIVAESWRQALDDLGFDVVTVAGEGPVAAGLGMDQDSGGMVPGLQPRELGEVDLAGRQVHVLLARAAVTQQVFRHHGAVPAQALAQLAAQGAGHVGDGRRRTEANSFEHYHPVTGIGSRYRGIDLYLHSYLLDNIFRIACGFAIRFGEVQDDPIGDAIDFRLQGMPLGNKLYDVERKNGRLKVQLQ